MMKKLKRNMVAFYDGRTYSLLVDRIVNSTERITCELRDQDTGKFLGKKVSLIWGGQGDVATLNTVPRSANWQEASEIEITLGPLAYGKFHSEGTVGAKYSKGDVFVVKVSKFADYL